ncbi:glutaredoxin [Halorubrum gandharaense]
MTFDPTQQGLDADEVESRVADAIETNDVVLFMKGTARMPQCGYSKKALGLLGQYRDEFETVDVLQNTDAFREALAERSGWETIPQTFVDGEFVGGSDVLEELDERGELAAELGVDPDTVDDDTGAGDAGSAGPEAPF